VSARARDCELGRLAGRRDVPAVRTEDTVMFSIIGWIIAGLIIGAIAKLLHPGKDPGGFVVTCLIGIGGALLGGFLGRAVGWYGPDESAGYIVSILGAIGLLAIYEMAMRGRKPHAV
jgi:uncharacterized membrane protein YeaQ/YmgE (transglycosylase-associated protein family)